MTTGLYLERCNKLEGLITNYPQARYRWVKIEKEGIDFLSNYFKEKGFHYPRRMRECHPHYPSLKQTYRHLGIRDNSSTNSSQSPHLDSSIYVTSSRRRIERENIRYPPSAEVGSDATGPVPPHPHPNLLRKSTQELTLPWGKIVNYLE